MIEETLSQKDERFMRMAIDEAREAAEEGEVPVGAVIVCDDRVIARAHNQTQRLNDVTAHAEMLALTAASDYLGGKYLKDCTMYVTLEPCVMCAGALGWSQISTIVYGASDPKRGYATCYVGDKTPLHPKTILRNGVLADECLDVLRLFFQGKR